MLEEGSFHKNFLTFSVDSEPLKFFLTVRTTISRYFSKILLLVCQKKILAQPSGDDVFFKLYSSLLQPRGV